MKDMKQTSAPSGAFLFSNESPTKEAFLFSSVANVATTQDDTEKRTFSGVAYSGELMPNHWAWGDLVFDLDSTQLAERVPALINHHPDKRAGYVTGHTVSDEGLTVTGNMLSNAFGAEVSRDGDEGFPWQMSVHIEPEHIEHIEQGEVTVNGKTFKAPITVFRNNTIREAGFVSVGADQNTSANIFSKTFLKQTQPKQSPNKQPPSKQFSTNPQPTGGNDMDLEQALAENEDLKAKLADSEAKREQAEAAASAAAAAQRETEVEALAKDTAAEFSEEDKAQFAAMSAEAFTFAAAQLRKAHANRPDVPEHLFNHTATNGTQPAPQGEGLDAAFDRAVANMQKGV